MIPMMSIVDWLTQFSEIKDATYVRGFLGRMLFAGEDGVKKMRVLSGGEKVRVLLSRMMIEAIQRPDARRADRPPGYGVHHRFK